MVGDLLSVYQYVIIVILMMVGFYGLIASENLIKKLIGLMVFKSAALLFYGVTAYVQGNVSPILHIDAQGAVIQSVNDVAVIYANPLSHSFILIMMILLIAIIALAMSMIIRIKEAYGTIEELDILAIEQSKKS